MSGMLRDFKAMRDRSGAEQATPTVVQLLRRAWLALDGDVPAARREIHRALEMLSSAPVRKHVQPDHVVRSRHGLAPWQVQRVIRHAHANLETQVRVEDMAAATRLSTSYFFRAFRRSFGMSPHAYIIALRLTRAREMLLESDAQISAIAMACGFADQAHFSRVFRREMGSAPGVWRREQRGLVIKDPTAGGNADAGLDA